jgi:hypothetical protein
MGSLGTSPSYLIHFFVPHFQELQKISDPHDLIRFLPHVIHSLCKACANPERAEQMSKIAFEGILWTFHTYARLSVI